MWQLIANKGFASPNQIGAFGTDGTGAAIKGLR